MGPSSGDALVCCVKRAVPATSRVNSGTAKTTHSNHDPNVMGLWRPVLISGFDGICRHTFRRVPSLQLPSDLPLRLRISLRIHHNQKERPSCTMFCPARLGFGVYAGRRILFCTPALFDCGPGCLRGCLFQLFLPLATRAAASFARTRILL